MRQQSASSLTTQNAERIRIQVNRRAKVESKQLASSISAPIHPIVLSLSLCMVYLEVDAALVNVLAGLNVVQGGTHAFLKKEEETAL